jgi:hypothetical protein
MSMWRWRFVGAGCGSVHMNGAADLSIHLAIDLPSRLGRMETADEATSRCRRLSLPACTIFWGVMPTQARWRRRACLVGYAMSTVGVGFDGRGFGSVPYDLDDDAVYNDMVHRICCPAAHP